MNQQENQERTNQAAEVEDLPVDEARQLEVKGGERKTIDGGILVGLDDLQN